MAGRRRASARKPQQRQEGGRRAGIITLGLGGELARPIGREHHGRSGDGGRGPFLRVVGLYCAGRSVRRMRVRRGHGQGGDGGAQLGVVRCRRARGEGVDGLMETGRITGSVHSTRPACPSTRDSERRDSTGPPRAGGTRPRAGSRAGVRARAGEGGRGRARAATRLGVAVGLPSGGVLSADGTACVASANLGDGGSCEAQAVLG